TFLITNRVPGEMAPARRVHDGDDDHVFYAADSALVNYVYRTPHYILGSTLQNPGLAMRNPETGKSVLRYSGVSRQNRWSGLLFEGAGPGASAENTPSKPGRNEVFAIYPVVEKTRGGRPQHPHWSFQHEDVLFMQRIAPQRGGMGSYGTGRMSIRFHGNGLEKTEEGGWIFATNGKAFAAVKFIDGGHVWDESGEVASPAEFEAGSTSRFLIHAGDVDADGSFDAFRAAILANPLDVNRHRVTYRPSSSGAALEVTRYDVNRRDLFRLPRVDGEPVDLRPDWTYRGPYLNGRFGEPTVRVTVGPIDAAYDFTPRDADTQP
ncbi:MAG: hypothetical protein AAF078_05595, partial [Planctomycetota bacterium]